MLSQALDVAPALPARKVGTTGMRSALSLSRLADIEGFAQVAETDTHIGRIVMRNAVHSFMLVAVGLFQVVVLASMILGH